MKTIGASIICMDHINFEADIQIMEDLNVDYLHLDVMDGHLVPRYGIYPEIVNRIADITDMKMDLHLMVADIPFALSQFIHVKNIEYITFHYEENKAKIFELIDLIHRYGKKAGVVFNLSTNPQDIEVLLNKEVIDCVMFMGIHPGVLKQESRPNIVIQTLQQITKSIDAGQMPKFVQCDGGVTFDTIPQLVKSGINNFICGSSTLFKDTPYAKAGDNQQRLNKISSNYAQVRALLDEN